jgi:enoyl-CoA hydratase/carnithine racemase
MKPQEPIFLDLHYLINAMCSCSKLIVAAFTESGGGVGIASACDYKF